MARSSPNSARGIWADWDADAAREAEHQGLRALTNLSLRADDLRIDVFGDAAVATFIMRADGKRRDQPIHSVERGTIVFAKDGGAWKIVHEHFSPFKPSP